ncbi:hypothetical protein CEXT_339581 [Caerostris extrusa]|uniref:Secreted protein n=1 Tax=Caerostris extrusa TaxID=172846 RepID=A0AAV4NIT4_CAEEX|nr:hypothetical protein CEXT_339581 [Caerostris extrusa]
MKPSSSSSFAWVFWSYQRLLLIVWWCVQRYVCVSDAVEVEGFRFLLSSTDNLILFRLRAGVADIFPRGPPGDC